VARFALVGVALLGFVLAAAGLRNLRRQVRQTPASPPAPAPASPPSAGPWPPEPVLGRPTPEDLKRYDRPARIPAILTRPPAAPLGTRARQVDRRIVRWGVAGLALSLLVFAGQMLEQAVYGKESGAEQPVWAGSIEVTCPQETGEALPDRLVGAACAEVTATLPETREITGTYIDPNTLPKPDAVTFVVEEGIPEPSRAPVEEVEPSRAPAAEPTAAAEPARPARCAPVPAEPAVRPVSRQVRQAVGKQWRRVERWLKAKAPRTHALLRPPAKARTIAIAEAQMGVRFPDGLRASLLRHNGASGPHLTGFGMPDGTATGSRLLGVREIRDEWRAHCRAPEFSPPAEGEAWHGRLIPFGSGLGHFMVADTEGGSIGRYSPEEGARFDGSSYYAVLKSAADAMEKGKPARGLLPVVRDGHLGWRPAG
jgi:hypothetical protein